MTDTDSGTEGEAPEAPTTERVETPATATGTQGESEVTLLKSRNAGLDAKVTSLTQQAAAEKKRADAAEARALALAEAGTNGDAELRTQLDAERADAAKARTEAKLARIEARYPETFGVLGDSAAGLTDEQLAASEARMKGVAQESDTPTPLGSNPPRGQAAAPKATADMSAAELRTQLRTFDPSVMFNA